MEKKVICNIEKREIKKIYFPKGELAHNKYKCRDCGYFWYMKSIYPTAKCPECGGVAYPLD